LGPSYKFLAEAEEKSFDFFYQLLEGFACN
jgi:hypothetical protein